VSSLAASSFARRLAGFRLVALFGAALVARAADPRPDAGWSADLLTQILKSEPARTESAAPAAAPATGAQEMVLRTYRPTHLRVGQAGKSQNVLAILGKLLPAGSSMNLDVPANSIHVLTTAAAHAAIWDYLSAVDIPEPAVQPAAVPDDVREALNKFAAAGEQSSKVLSAIGVLKADVARQVAEVDARQRRQTRQLAIAAFVAALLITLIVMWMLKRRARPESAGADSSTALALAPEQLATALVPVHDRMRNDMMGLLNEVAIKLQAQHNEQQKLVLEQQHQLEAARQVLVDERRQFITETGSMVVQAVERVDATTAKLARQQDKVAELVEELQTTVRELDATKDNLRDREIELEQERAKIAALSLLLEEGGAIPPEPPIARRSADISDTSAAAEAGQPSLATVTEPAAGRILSDPPCTTPSTRLPQPSPAPRVNGSRMPAPPQFTFLPPDHPET
jgi:hypothetical protein